MSTADLETSQVKDKDLTVTGKKIEIEADSSNMDEKEPESVDLTSKVDPPVQDETKIEEEEKDTDVPNEEAEADKESVGKNDENAASPDSTNVKIKPRKTPNMMATINEAKEILGSKSFGKTRSQDRKRSIKRASVSPASTPKRKRR